MHHVNSIEVAVAAPNNPPRHQRTWLLHLVKPLVSLRRPLVCCPLHDYEQGPEPVCGQWDHFNTSYCQFSVLVDIWSKRCTT